MRLTSFLSGWRCSGRIAYRPVGSLSGTRSRGERIIPLSARPLRHRKDTSMKLADPHAPQAPSARTRRRPRVTALIFGTVLAAAAVAATGCSSSAGGGDHLALAGNSSNSASHATALSSNLAGGYAIVTLNDARDVTFNQLLGITNRGIIAGYFG